MSIQIETNNGGLSEQPNLEPMKSFFDIRADIYDEHMMVDLDLSEFYTAVNECFRPQDSSFRLLDLGCGTGIELEKLFADYPDMQVTGIDLSQEMLNRLKEKFPGRKLTLICGSYFGTDLVEDSFDYAVSTYSLHHFSEGQKLSLYKKVYNSLKSPGIYIEGDYSVKTIEEQLFYISENERFAKEMNVEEGYLHCDVPFTAETTIRLLKEAGFPEAEVVRAWDNKSIIMAKK